MNCVYCYAQQDKNNKTISITFVKTALQEFYKKGGPLGLRLFGIGEPTTAFAKMKRIVEIAKSISSERFDIELQSNGYFPPAVSNWVEDNVDILWISCDGPPDIHDRYRPTRGGKPTSSVILDNIRRFSNSERCVLGVRATITSETYPRQKEIVEFFHSLGVKHISADPLFLPVTSYRDGLSFPRNLAVDNPEEYAEQFVLAHERALELGIEYNSIFTVNLGTNNKFGCRGCYTNPHLTVDGVVTCCDMAFKRDTPLKEMVWGRFDGRHRRIEYIQNAKKGIFRRRAGNIPECQGCEWEAECCGGCFGEALNETGDVCGVKKFSCRATKYILPRISRRCIQNIGHP
jgi:radical SAM protein with 4Fe4S-binding SPASM domain